MAGGIIMNTKNLIGIDVEEKEEEKQEETIEENHDEIIKDLIEENKELKIMLQSEITNGNRIRRILNSVPLEAMKAAIDNVMEQDRLTWNIDEVE